MQPQKVHLHTICGVEFPPPKPYLNKKQRYPVGNGIMMAVGDGSGAWLRLAGPGYHIGTIRDSLFTAETLSIEVDGCEHPLTPDMHRAAKTGVFYGTATIGDLSVCLVDLARWGQPWMARLVLVENRSSTACHSIRVKAALTPAAGAGAPPWTLVRDAHGAGCAYACKGYDPTHALILFSSASKASAGGLAPCDLITDATTLAPGASTVVALCHHAIPAGRDPADLIEDVRRIDYLAELQACVREWTAWFDDVPPAFRLERITDPRARDMVEGGLAILKTNQSQDGGLIAHATHYTQGYFRDAALGLRGFDATGHFEESKRWLQWTQSKFLAFRHIPNWASCLSSLAERGSMQDLGNQDMESTALCVLATRDYYRGTGDKATVTAVHDAIQYCMDAQLAYAAAHNDRMEFCGDETEICGAVDVSASGLTHKFKQAAENYWSMTSVALCAAALDFYIEYLIRQGHDPVRHTNSRNQTVVNLPRELIRLQEAMGRDYWRTDVPGQPEGFHDSFRAKADNAWPAKRITNFTLFPVYFGTPYLYPERRAVDVAAMARHFNRQTGLLQLVPDADTGFDGHTLGYLLWGMVATGHPDVEVVYQALINGPTADCWGSFAEAYSREGAPNDHDLRTFETGCNLSAVASYWKLGTTKQKGTTHEQAELRAEERNHPPAIHRTEKAAAEAVEEPAQPELE
ncbi:MAG: hypothetical protein WCR06_08725 [bacterium]